jgi:hypothetical protein
VLSLRIVTSLVFLTLAAGAASAQTTTTTPPGKPLQLFQIIQQSNDAAVQPRHRVRYVHRRVTKTRVADQITHATRHEYMQAPPEPRQAEATPTAATTVPANIWPAADVTKPGIQAQSSAATPPAAPILAFNNPATGANQNDMLTAAYDAVQVTPPSAAPPMAPNTAQVTPPSAPEAAPPVPVQVAQANTVSATDGGTDQPHDATNRAKTSAPVPSWPVQRAVFASAEPQNPNPVGSVSWIVHVLAALGGAIAAGALAWVLIDPLPARRYE